MIKIDKVLNNNVVMGYDRKKGEVVVVGTGIGFHAQKGDKIDEAKIQKIFVMNNDEKLSELIHQIPPEYLELVEDIFEYAQSIYQFSLEEKTSLALMDHIHFAVKRLREGNNLENPFTSEIRQFYQKEWEIGLYARDKIKTMFDVEIPDDEVGYIAMHMISSEYHQDKRIVNKVFKVINVSIEYIRSNYLGDVKEDSLAYTRLVTHVKYFAQRYVDDREAKEKDDVLKKMIQEVFQDEIACIQGLSELLYQSFGRHITDSESNYLVLHLRNCKKISG
jgi:beta-glucoside operon transcriptional antiterminator